MYHPKLGLVRRVYYAHHRSGWAYALRCLEPLFSSSPHAVRFDSMLEKSFALELSQAQADGWTPYHESWIGVVHTPFEAPCSWEPAKNPGRMFRTEAMQESLPQCRGLITLSHHLAEGLRVELPSVPVLALRHPTEPATITFDFEAYLAAGQPIVQVGWWLRRLTSIHWLPVDKRRKHIVVAQVGPNLRRYFEALQREREQDGAPPLEQWSARIVPHLSAQDYDLLLSRSVVFLHLHACSASNTIIECIVRRTPVLVNPLPSVLEYLGSDYPFCFETLEGAAAKASDPDLVLATHRYLANRDLTDLSGETFRRGLAEWEVYRSLPDPPAE